MNVAECVYLHVFCVYSNLFVCVLCVQYTVYSYLFVFVCVEGPSSHWVSVDVCRVLNQSGREFGALGVTL